MSGVPGLPPLPPPRFPPSLLSSCPAAFASSRVRTLRADLEVHRTHIRIVSPVVRRISAYARRMDTDDLVLSIEQIALIRPIGALTVILELPSNAAVALAGSSVRGTLAALGDAVPLASRGYRPFFVGFWLINQRTGRIVDARRLP